MIFYIVTLRIFTILFSIIGWIYIHLKYFGFKSKKLPPVENKIVLESATSLATSIRSRKLTSSEIVAAFIERIRLANPTLNALVADRFKSALEEANDVDEFIRENPNSLKDLSTEKPLFGVPFTIKDAFAVKGLPQTCGLYDRRNAIAEDDADCVKILKDAGAICLGVTNVPELCFSWETYNLVYGLTNNPYDISKTPGGSSGGEGSIISACGSVIGIGSDLGGSLRIPALFNGIFAHKPTPGIISTIGHFPPGKGRLNTTGPMCRYACDLLPMIRILSQNHQSLELDKKVDMKKLKIYYMLENSGDSATVRVADETKTGLLMAINYLKSALKLQCEEVNIDELNLSAQMRFGKLWELGGPDYITRLLKPANKGELCLWKEFGRSVFNASPHTPFSLFLALTETSAKSYLTSPVFANAMKNLKNLEAKFQDILGKEDAVFIYPTNPLHAPYHFETLFKYYSISYTAIFNVLGYPSTACPLGLSHKGLPLGIQIVGLPHHDRLCIAVAKELENAFGGWVSPSDISV